jgi:iron complex outermembrane recepter protein
MLSRWETTAELLQLKGLFMRLTLAMAAACLGIVGIATADPARASIRQHTEIPAQGLGLALTSLAKEFDFQVLYRTEVVGALRTQGASGAMTAAEALEHVLNGTGLTYEYLDEKTVTIMPVGSAAPPTSSGGNDSAQSEDAKKASQSQGGDRKKSFWDRFRLAQADTSSTSPLSSRSSDLNTPSAQSRVPTGGEVEQQEAGSSKLDEIIVTARKTSERLQDVPISDTVVGREQIENSGATDIKDILMTVPGLSYSNAERGQSKYTIRGINAGAASTASISPTTGIYLDDISLVNQTSTFAGQADPILFDMDRVEVLKGPQGTLYGASSMGGAIKYVSAKPDPSRELYSLAGGMATTSHGGLSYHSEAVFNLPLISDVLAVRAGVYAEHEGGYIDNVAGLDIQNTAVSSTPAPSYTPLIEPSGSVLSQTNYNYSDTYAVHLAVLWTPDSSWSIRPSVSYQDSNLANPNYFLTNQPGLVSSYRFIGQSSPDRLGIYGLEVTKEFHWIDVTSLTGYVDRTSEWNRDYSFLIGNIVSALYPFDNYQTSSTRTKTLSQEFRITSPSAPDSRLHWTLGLYYSRQRMEGPTSTITTLGGTEDLFATDNLYAIFGTTALDQSAVFGEATYRMFGGLEATVGLRGYHVKVSSESSSFGAFGSGGPDPAVPDVTQSGINPKVGLSYKIDRDHMVYASAAKGFRPGGPSPAFNRVLCAEDVVRVFGTGTPPDHYNSDRLWTYELGSKNEFDNNRILLNIAAFYTDWKGIQQTIRFPSCAAATALNAGAARVQGGEIEARVNTTAGLQIGGNVTLSDAKITDPGIFSVFHAGDEILDSPKWMGSAFGSYLLPVSSEWDLGLRADYAYRGGQRRVADPTQVVTFPGGDQGVVPYAAVFQGGYGEANLGVSLSSAQTTVRLYANNVFDSRPLLDTALSVGISRSTTIRPRTIGVEVRHHF